MIKALGALFGDYMLRSRLGGTLKLSVLLLQEESNTDTEFFFFFQEKTSCFGIFYEQRGGFGFSKLILSDAKVNILT